MSGVSPSVVLLDLQPPTGFYRRRRFESLGIAYVAAHLRSVGVPVAVEVLVEDGSSDGTLRATLPESVRMVGITVYPKTVAPFRAACARVKALRPSCAVVTGGYFASYSAPELLLHCPELDYVVSGEGEVTVLELYRLIASGAGVDACRGIYYRRAGRVERTPPRPLVEDLDTLPFPSRDVISREGRKVARLSTTRGCLHRCRFCAECRYWAEAAGSGPAWRARSPHHVRREMSDLAAAGVWCFEMNVDSCFEGHGEHGEERLRQLARELADEPLPMAFSVNSRAPEPSRERRHLDALVALREVGLGLVYVGFESGCDDDLRFYGKATSVARNRAFARAIEALDIDLLSGFIMFNPRSTPASLTANADFLADAGAAWNLDHFCSRLDVYLGTGFAQDHAVPWTGELSPPISDAAARAAFDVFAELARAPVAEELNALLVNWTWLVAMLRGRHRAHRGARAILDAGRRRFSALKDRIGAVNVDAFRQVLTGRSPAELAQARDTDLREARKIARATILELARAGFTEVVDDIRSASA